MTGQFKKDLKAIKKRSHKNHELIFSFLSELKENGAAGLDKKYLAHKLSGNYNDNWEAHVKPDLLIIWFEINRENEILLLRAGSHSDLF
ncbi:MAG: type II toxin-antitoxin system RelE/ParE family toxin [Mucilaginibacter sp.]